MDQEKQTSRSTMALACLLVAICLCFILQSPRNGFDASLHDGISAHGVALASNLSLETRLLLYNSAWVRADGKVDYDAYSAFPIWPFLLVKLAMLPCTNDLGLQVHAARQLMNAFFCLALVLAFLTLRQVVRSAPLALAASLLAFSSYYPMHYRDMIFNDVPALVGFVLALLVVARCEQRALPAWLVAAAGVAAVATGWQAYAVFSCWFVVDRVIGLRAHPAAGAKGRWILAPPTIALAASVLFGVLTLGAQTLNEWSIRGCEPREVSTIRSLLPRVGLDSDPAYERYVYMAQWGHFAGQQVYRATTMTTPLPVDWIRALFRRGRGALAMAGAGVLVALGVALLWVNVSRAGNDVPWKTVSILALSGIAWALPMRYFVAFHEFQALFWIGFSLAFFALLVRVLSRLPAWPIMALAMLVFILNLAVTARRDSTVVSEVQGMTTEFQRIRDELPKDSVVLIDGGLEALDVPPHAVEFYLSGHPLSRSLQRADRVVSADPAFPGIRLTDNPTVNLFRPVGR